MPPDPGSAVTSADTIHALATSLANPMFGTGPTAMLRRFDPAGALAVPALQRLLAIHVTSDHADTLRAWALLIHCMAIAAPDQHRAAKPPLGEALFLADYSEARLTRLLEARGPELMVIAPRLTRFLVSRGQGLDPGGLWRLIRPLLLRPTDWGAQAQAARNRIARDYYRAEAHTRPA